MGGEDDEEDMGMEVYIMEETLQGEGEKGGDVTEAASTMRGGGEKRSKPHQHRTRK